MKVLITGAGGFVGRRLAEKLVQEDSYEVYGIGRTPQAIEGVNFKCIDIRDRDEVFKFMAKNKFISVIHTAAKAGVWGSKKEYWDINYKGTLNLLDSAKKNGVRNFIYTSTPSVVFGDKSISGADEQSLKYPKHFLTHYAHSKANAEKEVLKRNSLNFFTTALRPHLIYGPGDPHILPRLLESNKLNRLRIVGNGDNKVNVTHIDLVVKAHELALKNIAKCAGKAYFLGDKAPVNLWDFINQMLVANGQSPVSKKVDIKSAYRIGFLMEVLYKILAIKKDPPMTRFVALQLGTDHFFNMNAIEKDLVELF
jgi:nucleoside-diphosphate-sugar epimerase